MLISGHNRKARWAVIEEILDLRARERLLEALRREGIDGVAEVDPPEISWPAPPRIRFDMVAVEPEVPERLYITDTTFRDGQQSFKAYSPEESTELFEILRAIDGGSCRILCSEFFLYTERDRRILEVLRSRFGSGCPRIIGWGRSSIEDVRRVEEAGLDEMVMLMSVSDIHIGQKLGLTRDRAVEKYLSAAEEAARRGISLRCSLEDVTRSDVLGLVVPLVRKLLRLGEKHGVGIVVKLPDTTGMGVPYPHASLPYSIPKLVWVLRRLAGVPPDSLEFHGHGDYYMGVSNAMAAWLHGAAINNATLGGIGERAGNVPLEALVILYSRIKGDFGGMNPAALAMIPRALEAMGYRVPRYQPIIGENAFSTMAGIHIDAQIKNPATYLSIDPRLVGREPRILIGPYSGTSGIAHWVRSRKGVEVGKNSELVRMMYIKILELYDRGEVAEPLSDEILERIFSAVANSM